LVFLPGAAEIRRVETLLRERVHDPAVDIVPLYGALDAEVQDRAIAPPPSGRRKVVLATSIAETSLTIEGVRVVIDCGLARVPRYEPDVGLTRLETVRVSRASAEQRRGRAGRTARGVCYWLWDEPDRGSSQPTGRNLAADLTGVLDLAHWGVADPARSPFSIAAGSALGRPRLLGDRCDRSRGSERASAAQLPLPPRLARMVVDAATISATKMLPRSPSFSPSAGSRG
jgi:ATP-dependent helicase HrpB